ncbi:hypothetical protein M378DRAFT_170509 [Amanita muscaria Koide BX008]|uniref:Uncharacterized protein n=1 Tax=Amanita muscaria (strain Koide BX008) TaxID=946122 RepID=A0A0C2WQK4_AMAMK|nr:hypothetical protein M378DRAFT_170509 [Amanita muscaria Koide BX008]
MAARGPVVQNQLQTQLCDVCHQKPKFSNHHYCSKTCAAQASAMCKYCHKKPKFQNFDYCGKNCAAQANAVAPNQQAPAAAMTALQQAPLPKVATNTGGKANPPKTFNPVAQVAKFVTQQMPQTQLPSTTAQPAGQVNGTGSTATSLLQGFNPFSNVTNQQPPPQQLAANGVSAQVSASTQPPVPPLPCLIPGCGKPVHIDSQGNSTDYCSKKHREDAVPLGLASPCIMCLTMPQSDVDYFCSKACRDEAMNKV